MTNKNPSLSAAFRSTRPPLISLLRITSPFPKPGAPIPALPAAATPVVMLNTERLSEAELEKCVPNRFENRLPAVTRASRLACPDTGSRKPTPGVLPE